MHGEPLGDLAGVAGAAQPAQQGLGEPLTLGRAGQLPAALWGSAVLQQANWSAHNPYRLADRLRGTHLYVSQGSGLPSDGFGNLEGAVLEGTLWSQARKFVDRLDDLGVPVRSHLYRGGTHAWTAWRAEFETSWPTLATGLGLDPAR
ncbi:esterase family protein [Streptomyces cellulosae]